MKNTIAVSLAVGVVLWALGSTLYKPLLNTNDDRDADSLIPSFSAPDFQAPALGTTPVGALAWNTWERYLKAAKTHDLETVRSLSHQLSPTCEDSGRQAECFALMDSVYGFGSLFKEADFKHVFYDDRQIIMMTDYETAAEVGTEPVQVVLFFTRTTGQQPKVLSMRFCFKERGSTEGGNCVETDPAKRDKDNNGWWDSVEALFYR